MNEIAAWQTGVDLGRAGVDLEAFLSQSWWEITGLIDHASRCALGVLGAKLWTYWVRTGYADNAAQSRS